MWSFVFVALGNGCTSSAQPCERPRIGEQVDIKQEGHASARPVVERESLAMELRDGEERRGPPGPRAASADHLWQVQECRGSAGNGTGDQVEAQTAGGQPRLKVKMEREDVSAGHVWPR